MKAGSYKPIKEYPPVIIDFDAIPDIRLRPVARGLVLSVYKALDNDPDYFGANFEEWLAKGGMDKYPATSEG